MQVEPLYDRVFVQQDATDNTLKEIQKEDGSTVTLVRSEEHAERPLRGTIVAVGCGRLLDNGDVKALRVEKGDRILFGRHNGIDLPDDVGLGKGIKVMREDEIMAVVRD